MAKITEEQMVEFFEFLQGTATPEGYIISHPPKLKRDAAFAVIYFLQERLRVLPDTFECCEGCGGLYDSNCEGVTLDGEGDMETLKGKPIPKKYWGQWHCECVPIEWRWAEAR